MYKSDKNVTRLSQSPKGVTLILITFAVAFIAIGPWTLLLLPVALVALAAWETRFMYIKMDESEDVDVGEVGGI